MLSRAKSATGGKPIQNQPSFFKRHKWGWIIIIAVAILLVGGGYLYYRNNQKPRQSSNQSPAGEGKITVEATGAKYKTVSTKPTGWLQADQDADILLSGIDFNSTGGPLLFNHPGVVASDGTHLLLADRNNNRVLIWNKQPTGNTPPDLVLGQKDFTANNPGTGPDQMNWPVSVSVGGGKVVVTDTNNDRILLWNTLPTKNGQAADLTIRNGAQQLSKDAPKNNPKRSIQWPWGVWTDGKKLAITSTANNLVLLWNSFPTQNDQSADIYLTGKGDFGTPRTITSDGNHLIIGDHNAKVRAQGGNSMSAGGSGGNFFWKNWPTQNDEPYSFFMSDPTDSKGNGWMQGSFTTDGKLIMLGNLLHIWNSFPENASAKPDLSVGRSGPSDTSTYKFLGGDSSGLTVVGSRLYISLDNSNKIVGFNSIPTKSSARPDFAIGAPDIDTNTLDTNFIMSNPVPVTDGKSLFVSSDFDHRLYVWKNLPDESNAHPDFVYSLTDGPWDNTLFENTLALAGDRSVFIWNKLPLNGELPNITLTDKIGDMQLQDLEGVAMDSKYFYLSDWLAGKIYVWEGVPSANSNPKFTIDADQPGRLSSDGKYLAITQTLSKTPGGSISIYAVDGLSSSAKPLAVLGGPNKFNLPQGALVSQGHLLIADTNNNRVLIWKNIEDAIAGRDAELVLGGNKTPQIGNNTLFWPGNLAFDGSFLWVGEFKFSERLLRFSVK